ncbi:MAG: MazG family protein [Lachnospiraceae bacterium]|nr:MazG family protein [Lachnospiraceae bacterium]MBQ6996145.1 MazG family protein [Lachnospiraceae bacterium]
MNKKYTFEEFVKIIEELRSENGCPWDREQTHESLRSCMMEEAAELLGAIRIYNQTGNAENMQEELGDILLQAVMHSVIAGEEGLFTIEDVISGISEKMIRRHPHVFADKDIEGEKALLQNWEEIKRQEKEGKSWITSPLREIPAELPSLTRGVKVAKKMDKLSQYYDVETGESRVPDYNQLGKLLVETSQKVQQLLGDSNQESEKRKQELSEMVTIMLRFICQLSYRADLQPEQLLYDDIEAIIAQTEEK